jgi:16S rRNA (cytidine1402-2'-O)-methyltransferase
MRYRDAPPRGEMVIVAGPPKQAELATDADLDSALRQALRQSSPSRAAANVAAQLRIPRKRAYARALELAKI